MTNRVTLKAPHMAPQITNRETGTFPSVIVTRTAKERQQVACRDKQPLYTVIHYKYVLCNHVVITHTTKIGLMSVSQFCRKTATTWFDCMWMKVRDACESLSSWEMWYVHYSVLLLLVLLSICALIQPTVGWVFHNLLEIRY